MDSTLSALRGFLEGRTGFDAVLVAPTLSMGRQLMDAYAARYGGALGLRVHTPDTLATEVCLERCPGRLNDDAASALVLSLLRQRGRDLPYFSGLGEGGRSLPAARELLRCFHLLERAGCPPPEGGARLGDLAALYLDYIREKRARRLWDRYDVFEAAAAILAERPLGVPAAICANVPGEGVVRGFLERLRAAVLPVPAAGDLPGVPSLFLPQSRGETEAALRFVRGYGAENEALYPFYDLLERQIPFGQASILYADPALLPLVRDQAARLGVPLTLDGGVPLEQGNLVPLLEQMSAWYAEDCPAEGLAGLMALGLAPPGGARLLRFLRENHAGSGLSRCLALLERSLDALPADSTPDSPEAKRRARLEGWRRFFREVGALFRPETGAEERAGRLGDFLLEYYVKHLPDVRSSEYGVLMAAAERLLTVPQEGGAFLPLLLGCAAGAPWQSAAPRDGAVHAAPLGRGVFLGRPYTYVLGLHRESMAAPGRESPLLRDGEREAGGIPTSRSGEDMPLAQLYYVLAAARGELTLSYGCFDTGRMLAVPPAPVYERLRGGRAPVLFGYRRPVSLTAADRWLAGGLPASPPPFPPAGGRPLRELIEAFRFSATSLETALSCPRRFYYQYILNIPQPEQAAPEGRLWLPANALGTLVHETLMDYFGRMIETGEPPALEPLWRERLDAARQAWPCPDPAVAERERRRMEGMLESALRYFRQDQHGNVPLAAELSFGGGKRLSQPFDMPEEFTLELDGLRLRFTGSVDRLDRLPSGGLCILDYKTGSSGHFHEDFDRKLQYFLYAAALRQLLGEPVELAAYLFLSPSGVRALSVRDPAGQAECLRKVKALAELLSDERTALTAQPVWRDGKLSAIPEDPEREKRLRSCQYFCPYAGICCDFFL